MPLKQHLVLHGGSADYRSSYSTSSAVAHRGISYPQRPPASPWMGEPQSRVGYLSSGYQNAFYRDAPPGSRLEGTTIARTSFDRPKTASLAETRPWPGEKDVMPFKSCLLRGEVREPRFYPFKIGSEHGAHALINPKEADPTARFAPPPPDAFGANVQHEENPKVLEKGGRVIKKLSGFSAGNSQSGVSALITERQDDGIARTPALTMREAERVAADSSRRFFHARDYYTNPFLTSNAYYQGDCLTQHAQMKRKKESLTAVPSTRPLTQYALEHNDPPFAPDVGEGIGLPIPKVGEGIEESWGLMPSPDIPPSVGLLPTAYSRVQGLSNMTGAKGKEPPPAPPLPERFARIRARHDYLRWGGDGADRYSSTSRVELCKPSAQNPLGGPRKVPPEGERTVPTDRTGYHMQITQNPIPVDPGC